MQFPYALSRQLAALTDSVDEPGTDLQAVLVGLADDLMAAVPSFLGLRMTLRLVGCPITVTTIAPGPAAAAGASLQFPLDQLAGAGPDGTVVLYAAQAGAFVDLAADTRRAHRLDGRAVVDGHLTTTDNPGAPGPPGVSGFDELSVVNRAIGLLIDRGRLPDEAHEELLR
ncbi:MAG TPA: hypothetical protein VII33_04565, partial [Nakamurella sp.]